MMVKSSAPRDWWNTTIAANPEGEGFVANVSCAVEQGSAIAAWFTG
jgi:hypothetical protein